MLSELSSILLFTLVSFILALCLYPGYIRLLAKWKMGKTLRETTATGEKAEIFTQLHAGKAGTPTMWGGIFLFVLLVMIWVSLLLQKFGWITYSLWNQQETYIVLFGFFSMGLIGLVDDILNIKNVGKVKGLSIRGKMFWLVLFSGFISYWFYVKLGIDYINLRPITGQVKIGILFPILTFFGTIAIVNAINITDGLDGLAGGLNAGILLMFIIATLLNGTYLTATVLSVMVSVLWAFLFLNVKPAKIFMGDSGAFALGGLIASTLYLLNMRTGIFIPFLVVFFFFMVELMSSGLQMVWKKVFKKKLFPIAPFHHYLEYKGIAEYTIVMKVWLVQVVLTLIGVLCLLVQYAS